MSDLFRLVIFQLEIELSPSSAGRLCPGPGALPICDNAVTEALIRARKIIDCTLKQTNCLDEKATPTRAVYPSD